MELLGNDGPDAQIQRCTHHPGLPPPSYPCPGEDLGLVPIMLVSGRKPHAAALLSLLSLRPSPGAGRFSGPGPGNRKVKIPVGTSSLQPGEGPLRLSGTLRAQFSNDTLYETRAKGCSAHSTPKRLPASLRRPIQDP